MLPRPAPAKRLTNDADADGGEKVSQENQAGIVTVSVMVMAIDRAVDISQAPFARAVRSDKQHILQQPFHTAP
jgi:hypothetical protein